MIDQKAPPKISPFAREHDLYQGVTQGRTKARAGSVVRRTASRVSVGTALKGQSVKVTAAMQTEGRLEMALQPLKKTRLNGELLQVPVLDSSPWKFCPVAGGFPRAPGRSGHRKPAKAQRDEGLSKRYDQLRRCRWGKLIIRVKPPREAEQEPPDRPR